MCSYHFAAYSVEEAVDKKSAILAADLPAETFKVIDVEYRKHFKGGDPEATPSMRVIYTTLKNSFSEYVCFNHQGYALQQAEAWFRNRMGDKSMPGDVDSAMIYAGMYVGKFEGMKKNGSTPCIYPTPKTITVKREGKFDRIIAYDFSPPTAAEIAEQKRAESLTMDDEWVDMDIPF